MRWTSAQAVIRTMLLGALALVPLTTLVHRNDVGRWDVQRSAMAAPDEFSYLLMARHFLHGGGLSLQSEIGRDTFYPPGYPLLLAAWWKCFGISAFAAHALNAALLCAAVLVVYFFCRRLLLDLAAADHRRFALSPQAAANLALLIAGIFATNWHVLETSLLLFSEPAFMLATFAWLALGLQWPDWHEHPGKAAAIALLAVAAWSIRGAGIVCVATTALYPLWTWWRGRARIAHAGWLRMGIMALVIGIPMIYQGALAVLAPEKSLASAEDSANSYPRQLLHGLLIHPDPNNPQPWSVLAVDWLRHIYFLVFGHLDDYASSFVPWLRENPDLHFRDAIGKIFGFLGLSGFLFHALRLWPARRAGANIQLPVTTYQLPRAPDLPSGNFLTLYVLLYIGLYLAWPFNMPRFWSPILPIMLVYGAGAVMRFGSWPPAEASRMRQLVPVSTLLALLLVLSAVEDFVQLGNYARRLNYVSDALAGGVENIIKIAPDGRHTIVAGMGDDERFMLAWYFSQARGGTGYQIVTPEPHLARKNGGGEHADEMLIRCLETSRTAPAAATGQPSGPEVATRLFFFSYFPNVDTRDTLLSFARQMPEEECLKIFQKEIIATVWEMRRKPASTQNRRGLP